MGYELHIFRQNNWDDDDERSNISLEEWLSYVESDEELKLTNGYESGIPGIENSWQDSPGFCEWMIHPSPDSPNKTWFQYFRGSISAKYPDDETIKKMITIANALNAKVQGDDGEYYDNSYFDKKEAEINKELKQLTEHKTLSDKKRWWKFW
jgi:hypothetical protein